VSASCTLTLCFKLRQIGGRHLTALSCDLEQTILMNLPLNPGGQIECL